jgi:hypothetical protein
MEDKETSNLLIFSLLFDFILDKLSINLIIFWNNSFSKDTIISSNISIPKKSIKLKQEP